MVVGVLEGLKVLVLAGTPVKLLIGVKKITEYCQFSHRPSPVRAPEPQLP